MKVLRLLTISVSSSLISSGMVEVDVGRSFIKSTRLTKAFVMSRHSSVSGLPSLRYLLQADALAITNVSSSSIPASEHILARFHRWPLQSLVGTYSNAVYISVVILSLIFVMTAWTGIFDISGG